jgi:hypothetical protein
MRNTLLFLKNKSATFNSDTKFYRWTLMNPIQARKDELLMCQVIEAEIPKTYYNVNSTNNVFSLNVITLDTDTATNHTSTFSLTLTPKNYSALEIASQINNISNSTYASIGCAFDNQTGKITITIGVLGGDDVVGLTSFNDANTCNRLIGFVSTTSISQVGVATLVFEADRIVDLNLTNNVYIETDLLLESRNTRGEKSGILAKVQMEGGFLSLVHYQTAHNIPIELGRKDTYLDHIDLRFVDDNDVSVDFNGDNDFSITLLFNYIKKDKLLLGDEIVTDEHKPYIDTINTGDSCDEYSDNEI